MILIADSGSTKTQWEILNPATGEHHTWFTGGINPFYLSSVEIQKKIESQLLPKLDDFHPEKIYFYGAGCSQQDQNNKVSAALQGLFDQSVIKVNHDLLGAAIATCGNKPGITAILGTGSNSCLFDGKEITDNIPSLGFLLGDEGNAGHFGRKLLQAYYYRELPDDLKAALDNSYDMDKSRVLSKIYDLENPNQFVATFAKFLSDHHDHAYVIAFLKTGFTEFIERNILKYEGHDDLPIHFIGSMAVYNEAILKEVLKQFNLHIGVILKSPMEGMLKYHLEHH